MRIDEDHQKDQVSLKAERFTTMHIDIRGYTWYVYSLPGREVNLV